MATRMIKALLEFPWIYESVQHVFGLPKFRRAYIDEYVKPSPGMHVLDIGCGPGVIVPYLSVYEDIQYLGIDVNPNYVRKAERQYGNEHCKFQCADISALGSRGDGQNEPCQRYDIVMMNGVMHHLSDAEVGSCLRSIVQLLKDEGRFCSFDPVYGDKPSRIERLILGNDRGKFVRVAAGYEQLVRKYLPNARYAVRIGLHNLPTHGIIFY